MNYRRYKLRHNKNTCHLGMKLILIILRTNAGSVTNQKKQITLKLFKFLSLKNHHAPIGIIDLS